ncbi:hypothetical protein HPB52_018086 [Rhipicephalus sanguineus]|uniref:Uncharacterized protein n=1 Tax=Rhipicephalus sanguineus TaxID=34632 RepID=A0A9D4SXM9_RHISA|nr:hypothetical protein HPB52_018086 [Rhipicephalus sanguineus]
MSRGVDVEEVKAAIRAPPITIKRTPSPKSSSFTSRDIESREVSYARLDFGDASTFIRWIADTVKSSRRGRDFYMQATETEEIEYGRRLFRIQRSPPEPGRPSLFRPAQGTLVSPPSWRFLPTSSGFYDALEQVNTNLSLLLADNLSNGINDCKLQDSYAKRFGSLRKHATSVPYATVALALLRL